MMQGRAYDLKQLRSARPVCTRAEFDGLLAKLDGLPKQASAAIFALMPGREALLCLRIDKDAAIGAARVIQGARDVARTLRRMATVVETGAMRADCAIRARADHRLIFEEATHGQ